MSDRFEYFCQDSECTYYNYLWRLEIKPQEMLSGAEKTLLGAAKLQCKKKCGKTAYELYHWLKQKGLVKLTSNLD